MVKKLLSHQADEGESLTKCTPAALRANYGTSNTDQVLAYLDILTRIMPTDSTHSLGDPLTSLVSTNYGLRRVLVRAKRELGIRLPFDDRRELYGPTGRGVDSQARILDLAQALYDAQLGSDDDSALHEY